MIRAAYHRFVEYWRRRRPLGNDEGQAAVESAIVLPLMAFLVFGTIQMTMIQQARLMTEYAAFQACRAGIVWNADRDQMRRAATLALVPTFGRADDLASFTVSYAKLEAASSLTAMVSDLLGFLPGGIGDAVRIVDVDTLHPTEAEYSAAGPLGSGEELDFDRLDTPEAFTANRLQVRVTYLYLMKIPFANWIIHDAWMATRAGIDYTGAIDRPETSFGGPRNRDMVYTLAVGRELFGGDFERLARMAAVALLATQANLYFIPLEATYSMRMQSNLFQDNLQY